jgi:hypothetical protein
MRLAVVTAAGVGSDDVDQPLLHAALSARGVPHDLVIWDDPACDWDRYSMILVRSTWDYTERPEEYLVWTASVADRLHNPAAVIAWNTDKVYLDELQHVGLPVIPTEFITPAESAGIDAMVTGVLAMAQSFGDRPGLVIKPTISAGSKNTSRHHEPASACAEIGRLLDEGHTLMVQPYIAGIDEDAETGAVFIEHNFSHGFAKAPMLTVEGRPPEPDRRHFVREQVTARQPSASQLEVAERVAAWTKQRFGQLLYQRIDMVPGPEGPLVIELELIEPSLFLTVAPDAANHFAVAVERRLTATT